MDRVDRCDSHIAAALSIGSINANYFYRNTAIIIKADTNIGNVQVNKVECTSN